MHGLTAAEVERNDFSVRIGLSVANRDDAEFESRICMVGRSLQPFDCVLHS